MMYKRSALAIIDRNDKTNEEMLSPERLPGGKPAVEDGRGRIERWRAGRQIAPGGRREMIAACVRRPAKVSEISHWLSARRLTAKQPLRVITAATGLPV